LNAKRAAEDEGGHGAPVDRVAHAPDAGALRDKSAQNDQQRVLLRRNDVQPYAGDHEAHGEARQTGGQPAEKSRCEKKR